MGENRQEFQRELEAIEAKVIELFAMVAEDLPRATQALLTGDDEVLAVLIEREQIIDALYPQIEELVNRELVLQSPVAVDLRFLLSVLRIVPELERMGELAAHMWRQAADVWYQRDRSAVLQLEERDEELDELHASLMAELA